MDTKEHPEHEDDRGTVTLIVFAPSVGKPQRFSSPESQTVGAAAEQAALKFGLHPTAPSFATKNGHVFDRTLTLDQVDIDDEKEVDLVDVGGGV